MVRKKTPKGSVTQFSVPGYVHDVVTHANSCQNWL